MNKYIAIIILLLFTAVLFATFIFAVSKVTCEIENKIQAEIGEVYNV